MSWKIKAKPEDFIVREQATLPLFRQGEYALFLLEKRGRNTLDVLEDISKKARISIELFAYGGRKDRHAFTTQYISIKTRKMVEVEGQGYQLKFVGRMGRPMGPDLIESNKFRVTVRDLGDTEMAQAQTSVSQIRACGCPNYFDDQRLASFDSVQGFFAEKLLKKQFNGALKIHMTAVGGGDSAPDKERKSFLIAHWRDWGVCADKAKTPFEKAAFALLTKKDNGFVDVLRQIPKAELSIYLSAYQAYLWNEVLRRWLRHSFGPLPLRYGGLVGPYEFYEMVDPVRMETLRQSLIATPGVKMMEGDSVGTDLLRNICEEQEISAAMFNRMKLRQAYMKSFLRSAIMAVDDLAVTSESDELYPGQNKMILDFTLPRGSFGTMLVKRLFAGRVAAGGENDGHRGGSDMVPAA